MDATTRELVRQRANRRCEFCRIPEAAFRFSFHVEHGIPLQHGGSDDVNNLGYACPKCNLLKGTNLATIDPLTNEQVQVFNPRAHV